MNQTKNYKLCQWVASDKLLRSDFNSDNNKIDKALANETEARKAADTNLEERIKALEEKIGIA